MQEKRNDNDVEHALFLFFVVLFFFFFLDWMGFFSVRSEQREEAVLGAEKKRGFYPLRERGDQTLVFPASNPLRELARHAFEPTAIGQGKDRRSRGST